MSEMSILNESVKEVWEKENNRGFPLEEIKRLNALNKELAERLAAASEALAQRACLKLEPDRGHPGFRAILKEIWNLHLLKGMDYGTDDDPLANLRGSVDANVEPWRGTWIRALDKVNRIKTYCKKGTLANEGVEDSFKDLANYSLLCLLLFREEKQIE